MILETESPTDIAIQPVFTFPPIASFWRRLAAWLIDSLILGIIGQVLGWSLSFYWFQIGPYGRIVGLLFILPYFGLLNSRIGKGQTVGKRIMKIAVRDLENKPIGIRLSFLRISILSVPVILNGWALPVFQNRVLQWLLAVLIFGAGSAILCTMIFNRKARQGLHDLICKTYVVHLSGAPIEAFPQSAKSQWVLAGGLIALSVLAATANIFISQAIISRTSLKQLEGVYQTLQKDDHFFSASVNDSTVFSSQGRTTHLLQVQVWYKGAPPGKESNPILNNIAQVVLSNTQNIEKYDLLKITVTSAYDLGIASGNLSFGDSEPIDVWIKRIGGSKTL